MDRSKTRQIKAGGVAIGGGAPVSVQSMCCTDTRDAGATLAQIEALRSAGCDIVRVAVPDEAAARSLSDRTPEKVAALVGNIVEERMNLEQFSDCDITMRELTVVTRTVTNQLAGVYHSRVKYPKLVLSRK